MFVFLCVLSASRYAKYCSCIDVSSNRKSTGNKTGKKQNNAGIHQKKTGTTQETKKQENAGTHRNKNRKKTETRQKPEENNMNKQDQNRTHRKNTAKNKIS